MQIAAKIIKTFTEDETIDKVFLVFTQFKTVLSQEVKIEQLLPIPKIEAEETGDKDAPQAEYIYEQPAAEIFGKLAAETGRNANLPRNARIGRVRTGFANDGDGFGFEKCGRID